jgi:hypothetical protein
VAGETLVWVVVFLVLPFFSLATFALGVWWRRRSPLWLPIAAAAPPLAMAIYLVPDLRHADLVVVSGIVIVWCLLGVAGLAFAAFALRRSWPTRGAWLVAGLIEPALLMGYLCTWVLRPDSVDLVQQTLGKAW